MDHERGSDVASQTVRVTVKGKNIQVTPALREYAEKRVAKLAKYFQWRQDVQVEVMLSVERDTQIAEITYHLGGLLMRGESRSKDLYASIDEASAKIERQVKKYKNKIQQWEHKTLRTGDGAGQAVGQGDGQVGAGTGASLAPALDDDEDRPKVVRTKRFGIKPMDVEEAIMQMELLGHDFFVFANSHTDEVNVLYKRKDGHYGLIEPTLEDEA